jgi:hypothetical protein
MPSLIRTQVQLTPEQFRAVKELARRQGRSVADVVRESLQAYLNRQGSSDREELLRRATAVVGSAHSGLGDLSVEHDKYFAESAEK